MTIRSYCFFFCSLAVLTTVISFPADFRNALVHFIFLGFLFFIKFLWHLDLQNSKVCTNKVRHTNCFQNCSACLFFYLCVVPGKSNSMSRVYRATAKVADTNPHLNKSRWRKAFRKQEVYRFQAKHRRSEEVSVLCTHARAIHTPSKNWNYANTGCLPLFFFFFLLFFRDTPNKK